MNSKNRPAIEERLDARSGVQEHKAKPRGKAEGLSEVTRHFYSHIDDRWAAWMGPLEPSSHSRMVGHQHGTRSAVALFSQIS